MPPALARYVTWPNAVSLLRLPLALVFASFQDSIVRVTVLGLAAATDYLDGWLARRMKQGSRSGELVDPLTDKIFLLVALGGFAAQGQLELWELLLLLARDLYTGSAFLVAVLLGLQIRFRARWAGKVATGVQLGAVLLLLARPDWSAVPAIVAGLVNLYAIIDYSRAGLRSLRRSKSAR